MTDVEIPKQNRGYSNPALYRQEIICCCTSTASSCGRQTIFTVYDRLFSFDVTLEAIEVRTRH